MPKPNKALERWTAVEWLSSESDPDIEAESTDDEIAAEAKRLESDALNRGARVAGLYEWCLARRETLRARQAQRQKAGAALQRAGGDKRKAARAMLNKSRGRPKAEPWTLEAVRVEAIRRLAGAGVTWTRALEKALRVRLRDTSNQRAREEAKVVREAFEAMERLAALTEKKPPLFINEQSNAARVAAHTARLWLQTNGMVLARANCTPMFELPRKMDRLRQNPRPELPQGLKSDHFAAILWLLGWRPKLVPKASVAAALKAVRDAIVHAAQLKRTAAEREGIPIG